MIKQLSATPISISANEMYEALSRGIIDCATHTITNQKTRSLGEVAHNVILDSLGGFVGGSTINLRLSKWDALTADERTAILKNVPQLITESLFAYIDQDTSARKEMEAKGNKFYHLDSDAGAVIKKYREDYVAKDAVEKGTAHGIEHAQQIADEVRALRSKWDKLLEENGRDPATFQKLLWQEVYSKVSVN
jgi:TRAP-type C4-dicarboxylate transport system substrate-binding protein